MGLPDRCGILIAKWQEVEKLSQVEQSLNIILKSTVSHTYEKAIRHFNEFLSDELNTLTWAVMLD